jgi:hypothetical protein
MGCILGCFDINTPHEPKIFVKNYREIYSYSDQDFYIDYYLATRFDLWD